MEFKAPPARLFKLYLDSRQHSAATHAAAVVSKKVGGKFSAFDGVITGRMLLIVPNRPIVQSWRAKHWKKTDRDSILVLTFSKTTFGAQIDLVHVNVPAHDHDGVRNGWERYYWKPRRAYLERAPAKPGARGRTSLRRLAPLPPSLGRRGGTSPRGGNADIPPIPVTAARLSWNPLRNSAPEEFPDL